MVYLDFHVALRDVEEGHLRVCIRVRARGLAAPSAVLPCFIATFSQSLSSTRRKIWTSQAFAQSLVQACNEPPTQRQRIHRRCARHRSGRGCARGRRTHRRPPSTRREQPGNGCCPSLQLSQSATPGIVSAPAVLQRESSDPCIFQPFEAWRCLQGGREGF